MEDFEMMGIEAEFVDNNDTIFTENFKDFRDLLDYIVNEETKLVEWNFVVH